jgi:hypothetical protein
VSRKHRLAAFEAVVDRSGVAALLDDQRPHGGREAQLSAKAVLVALMLGIDRQKSAHLTGAHGALADLSVSDRIRIGAHCSTTGVLGDPTYRQVSSTHDVLVKIFDPTPVPSFRGVEKKDRRAHLDTRRRGIDVEALLSARNEIIDRLVEASVPGAYKQMSSSLAIDWTDHETWSRPKAKDDPCPPYDPDATWGHAKRNAPGAKEQPFFGYYAQVATMVSDDGAGPIPELVRRIAFGPAQVDPSPLMATALVRMADGGVALGDVLADCGYSNRTPHTFALPLRRAGAAFVMDLHPQDLGRKGTYAGAVISNGNLYCPSTPATLLDLESLPKGADGEDAAAHERLVKERARFKLGIIAGPNKEVKTRVVCPALLGKVRCSRREESLALDFTHPDIAIVPAGEPLCCVQKTITVPVEICAKTSQRIDYPSEAHRRSYARRVGAERTYAWLATVATIGIRRGWSRLAGTTKNALMYALGVIVRNVRLIEKIEREVRQVRREESVMTETGTSSQTDTLPEHEPPSPDDSG